MVEKQDQSGGVGVDALTGSALGENVCMSGGATGADVEFGLVAEQHDHQVIHWSFVGHNSKADTIVLTEDHLREADPYLRQANRTLKRSFPPRSTFVANLLRRNFYQVRWTERVYAVANFDGGLVAGGTAWAVQMFIDRHHGQPSECYVFSQDERQWYVWKGKWAAIVTPPTPEGIYTGIGSRKLTDFGKNAIHALYG